MANATSTIDNATTMLSFPAILRNSGLTNRFAHLQDSSGPRLQRHQDIAPLEKRRRDQNDGKRWLRRSNNVRFVGNPHIVTASKRDYLVLPPQTRSTFPEPLPSYLPRTAKLPSVGTPMPTNPISANAGRFSLSLKGMRRELRRQGGRAEALVKDVENEMVQWLHQGGIVLAPGQDITGPGAPALEGTPIGSTEAIVELSRTPLQLIWRIPDDSFARYVVHCCARYHEIVSFSKGNSDQRLTYLLRPNVTRPDHHAPATIDTPPATDLDYSSNPDVDTDSNIDSDFISDRDLESDVEVTSGDHELSTIEEDGLLPSSPQLGAIQDATEDTWSFVGDADADIESSTEFDLDIALHALALSPANEDPDRTITSPVRSLHRPHPLHASRRAARSASSPSRSPARVRHPQRRRPLYTPLSVTPARGIKRSFYEYIFS